MFAFFASDIRTVQNPFCCLQQTFIPFFFELSVTFFVFLNLRYLKERSDMPKEKKNFDCVAVTPNTKHHSKFVQIKTSKSTLLSVALQVKYFFFFGVTLKKKKDWIAAFWRNASWLILACALITYPKGGHCQCSNPQFAIPSPPQYDCSRVNLTLAKGKLMKVSEYWKTLGYQQSAANMDHFLENTGTSVQLSVEWTKKYTQSIIQNIVLDNTRVLLGWNYKENVFSGVLKRGLELKDGTCSTNRECLTWTDSHNIGFIPNDFFFAVGGYTFYSDGVGCYCRDGDQVLFDLHITHILYDYYDFNPNENFFSIAGEFRFYLQKKQINKQKTLKKKGPILFSSKWYGKEFYSNILLDTRFMWNCVQKKSW
ncbi:hypothetical protein RFI_19375 [Reticulomyxa filosa]|uniref:Uncharacterized protein n=1 Tax=Reticulomyxa filosa TaxID=46433 RepID=X6MWT7_RETFI|nr:hypothetical protein RFI_19375 [Reticulomyxa filosa]|eukprot:ETO17927.1 hypothetical protein RFI_19375 [Reticulomyxa filosa]